MDTPRNRQRYSRKEEAHKRSFDKKAFLFVSKLSFVLLLLVLGTQLLASWAGAHFFLEAAGVTTPPTREDAPRGAFAGTESPKAPLPSEAFSPRFISGTTIEAEVPDEGKFVAANLDTMKLFLYEDEKLIQTFDILSKGRNNTRWETPSGLYEVLYKNENHLSSIGGVYMPYSMQFYGNFFIHGWPYYPGGKDVPKGFSGGCIRLSTEDAKEVFEFTDLGTPVFVFAQTTVNENAIEIDRSIPKPLVSAESFLVADIETGQVYAEKNADVVRPIASLTKLLTALVANENIASERLVTVTSHAASTIGNQADFTVGEKYYARELVYPLLLISANDAALAYGDYFGGSYFASLMNKQAAALGMDDSYFVEPTGLSEKNVSTARDLFALSRYLYHRKGFVFDITELERRTVSTVNAGTTRTFENIHPLEDNEAFRGGKNGYISESGLTLITLLETEIAGEMRTVAVIVLNAPQSAEDSLALMSWLKDAAKASEPEPEITTLPHANG